MMPGQTICFGATMFLALAALLKWKYRRVARACRLERSLRSYTLRVLAELSAEVSHGLQGTAWRAA